MNKVIARLKQLASHLKKWGDVLDIFLNYSFNEYKGIAVMALGNKYTLSVGPARKTGGVSAKADFPATNLRIGLHEGKVATEKTLIDSTPVKVGEFNAKALADGIRGWLTQDHGISSSVANSVSKEIGEIYQDILNGGMAKSPAEYLEKQPKRESKAPAPAQEEETEIPLSDMSPVSKTILKVMNGVYPAKAVSGKMISLNIYGTTVDCSVVKSKACIEFNRGNSQDYSVVSVPLPRNPIGLPDTLGQARKQMVVDEPEPYLVMYLFLTLLALE